MHRIWAVARNTIAQALRMKVAVVIIFLLLILLPLMSMIMVGDGTLIGKLQTFTSYGLSLTSLLLCLLTIVISTFTLSNDLKRQHIFLVITKPVRRFELLLGKLLGVVLVDVFLLFVFAAIIYGLTISMPKLSKAGDEELSKAQREFFTARASLSEELDIVGIQSRARETFDNLEKTGQLPEGMSPSRALKTLMGQEKMKANAVEVGGKRVWEFSNIRARDPNEPMFVRFKYAVSSTPPDSKVYGSWLVGDYRQRLEGPGGWKTPVYRVNRADTVKTVQEFEFPADAIAEDGYLAVVFINPFINQTTVIPEDVALLLKADSFTGNFIRVALMILVQLVFLAALGVSMSTWLSFPVAILVCMAVFCTGTVNGFIIESLDTLGSGASLVYVFTVKPLLWLLPRFDGEYSPTGFMIAGKLLSWWFLGKVFAVMVCIKGLLLMLFGIWAFSVREIAKITA